MLDQLIERQRERVAEEDRRIVESGIQQHMRDAARAGSAHRRHLEELLARRTARDEAIAIHETAQREHADDLVLLGQELQDARRNLAGHVTNAIAALDTAWQAAEAYDALLAQRAGWLRSLGLAALYQENHDDEVRFDLGGHESTALGRPHLLLDGERWHPVNPHAVVQYVRCAVVAGHVHMDERRNSPLHELLDPLVRRPAPVPLTPVPAVSRPMVDADGVIRMSQ